MVGPGVVEPDPEDTELNLEGDPALATLFGGEDRPIISQHLGGDSPLGKSFAEAGDHVRAGGVRSGITDQTEPGVVINNVQDRHLGAVGQPPMSDIGLPTLIRLIGAKPLPR